MKLQGMRGGSKLAGGTERLPNQSQKWNIKPVFQYNEQENTECDKYSSNKEHLNTT